MGTVPKCHVGRVDKLYIQKTIIDITKYTE